MYKNKRFEAGKCCDLFYNPYRSLKGGTLYNGTTPVPSLGVDEIDYGAYTGDTSLIVADDIFASRFLGGKIKSISGGVVKFKAPTDALAFVPSTYITAYAKSDAYLFSQASSSVLRDVTISKVSFAPPQTRFGYSGEFFSSKHSMIATLLIPPSTSESVLKQILMTRGAAIVSNETIKESTSYQKDLSYLDVYNTRAATHLVKNALSPIGRSVFKFTQDSTYGTHYAYIQALNANVADNTQFGFSFDVKALSCNKIKLGMFGKAGSYKYAEIDLLTGVASSITSGLTVNVESIGDGWVHVCGIMTSTTGASNPRGLFFVRNESGLSDYTGNGYGGLLYSNPVLFVPNSLTDKSYEFDSRVSYNHFVYGDGGSLNPNVRQVIPLTDSLTYSSRRGAFEIDFALLG